LQRTWAYCPFSTSQPGAPPKSFALESRGSWGTKTTNLKLAPWGGTGPATDLLVLTCGKNLPVQPIIQIPGKSASDYGWEADLALSGRFRMHLAASKRGFLRHGAAFCPQPSRPAPLSKPIYTALERAGRTKAAVPKIRFTFYPHSPPRGP